MELSYLFEDENYDYEPESSDLNRVLKRLSGVDVYSLGDDEYLELFNEYYDALHGHFYNDALEDFKEEKLYHGDKYSFYGVNRSDF